MSVSRSVISGGVSSLENEVWCVFFVSSFLLMIVVVIGWWVLPVYSNVVLGILFFFGCHVSYLGTLFLSLSLNRTEQNTYINGVALRQANYRGLGGTIGRCVITLRVSTSCILLLTQ